MKKLIVVLFSLVSLYSSTIFAESITPAVKINGKEVYMDQAPFITNGRSYVPLRVISESLGAQVYWDGATQGIEIKKGLDLIKIRIGSKDAIVNNTSTKMDVAPVMKKNSAFVPLRFVGETLKANVVYSANTIIITSGTGTTGEVEVTQPTPPKVSIPKEEKITDYGNTFKRSSVLLFEKVIIAKSAEMPVDLGYYTLYSIKSDGKTVTVKLKNHSSRDTYAPTLYLSDKAGMERRRNATESVTIDANGIMTAVYPATAMSDESLDGPKNYKNYKLNSVEYFVMAGQNSQGEYIYCALPKSEVMNK